MSIGDLSQYEKLSECKVANEHRRVLCGVVFLLLIIKTIKNMQGIGVIIGTIFSFGFLAWIITEIIYAIRPKSTQFTMQNPPPPPKTEYEVYCYLNLERIELVKKISEVDFKLNEILSKQPTWYKNQPYETALKSMSNNLKDVMPE